MLCQNYGRQVEFVGNVCPWCGAQKLQSQTIQIFFYVRGSSACASGTEPAT